jgi:hypothetical protein
MIVALRGAALSTDPASPARVAQADVDSIEAHNETHTIESSKSAQGLAPPDIPQRDGDSLIQLPRAMVAGDRGFPSIWTGAGRWCEAKLFIRAIFF